MPRPGTSRTLRRKIEELIENDHKLSAGAILLRLKGLIKTGQLIAADLPTERTIARIKKAWLTRLGPERQDIRYLHRPERFEEGALPWDAAKDSLELLHWWNSRPPDLVLLRKARKEGLINQLQFDKESMQTWSRPTNRTALWFWRITEAAPDAPIGMRYVFARYFNGDIVDSSTGEPAEGDRRAIEAILAYRPWASRAEEIKYFAAVKKMLIPAEPPFLDSELYIFSLKKKKENNK